MPIPEPSRYRPSNLTKEQRQDQMAALYGVKMDISHADLERMRQIVKDHDAQRQPMKTIDLNNPPREPYSFQKFPKMVYDLARSQNGHIVSLIVRSEDDLAEALADGYSEQAPAFGNMPEDVLSPQYQQAAMQVDEQLEAARRGVGRPRKTA